MLINVMDNFTTHTASALYEVYEPSEAKRIWNRFNFIYTPKHGSWLNLAEIELNVLHGQCLNRRIDNFKEVKRELRSGCKLETVKNQRLTGSLQQKTQ